MAFNELKAEVFRVHGPCSRKRFYLKVCCFTRAARRDENKNRFFIFGRVFLKNRNARNFLFLNFPLRKKPTPNFYPHATRSNQEHKKRNFFSGLQK